MSCSSLDSRRLLSPPWELGTGRSYKKINLLSLPVVLSCQDQEHHLSEEHKAGKGEVATVPPWAWSSQSRHWLTRDCVESNVKPSASVRCLAHRGCSLNVGGMNVFTGGMQPHDGCRAPLSPAGRGRALASGCILRLYLSFHSYSWLFPVVTLCSAVHPHAGLLRCEDWRQRCWQNCDWPLWKGCAQDCGKFCRARNRGGMSQFWIP